MKKNPQEESAESQPKEKLAETKIEGDGRSYLKIVLYVAIVVLLAFVLYKITHYSSDTFKVNM